jgi:hypothetical protein
MRLVMCEAADVDASTREIKDFNDLELFAGGGLQDTPVGFQFRERATVHVRRVTASGATCIRRGNALEQHPFEIG